MEKLIELLNEYEGKTYSYSKPSNLFYRGKYEFYEEVTEEKLISKKYGFIKWLVDNDKIDIKALIVKWEMRSGWDFDNKKWNEESGEEIWNKYYSELCLMLLSIQDNPIDFLLSILK